MTTDKQQHEQNVLAEHGIARSPLWRHAEESHLKRQPNCICCKPGTQKGKSQVHHRYAFEHVIHLGFAWAELYDGYLDENGTYIEGNLVTLCERDKEHPEAENHHLEIGHLKNFETFNKNVLEDATQKYYGMSLKEITENVDWEEEVKTKRIGKLSDLSDEDKEALRKEIEEKFPMNSEIQRLIDLIAKEKTKKSN